MLLHNLYDPTRQFLLLLVAVSYILVEHLLESGDVLGIGASLVLAAVDVSNECGCHALRFIFL